MDTTPMSRAIETASDIARLQTLVEGLTDTVDRGFARNDAAMARIDSMLDVHDRHLATLSAREQRNRSVVKWVAGVASAVVAAIVLLVIGAK